MPDANPEVMVLWRGEMTIRSWLHDNEFRMHPQDVADLKELLPELERIRLMRVARWNQRKRAAQAKKRARVAESERLNRGAQELVKRRARRDRLNGET